MAVQEDRDVKRSCLTCAHASLNVSEDPCNGCVHHHCWEAPKVATAGASLPPWRINRDPGLEDRPVYAHLASEYEKSERASNVGMKFDEGKAPMDLLDYSALEQIAQVLAFGARKYEAHNWRKGISVSRNLAAALRHIMKYTAGEKIDPESGLSHLAHAGCCVMFALSAAISRPDLDDTYKPT